MQKRIPTKMKKIFKISTNEDFKVFFNNQPGMNVTDHHASRWTSTVKYNCVSLILNATPLLIPLYTDLTYCRNTKEPE